MKKKTTIEGNIFDNPEEMASITIDDKTVIIKRGEKEFIKFRTSHVGLDSIYAERGKLLDTFDIVVKQSSEDKVKTEHGNVGEAQIRNWLESFLPKRFGVCKGYIITPDLGYLGNLEEWDVIVYDAIESPVLFTRSGNEKQDKRAIPVEYVRAVIEVKAALNPRSAKDVAKKLNKLNGFLSPNSSSSIYPHISPPFICSAIFFDTNVKTFHQYRKALNNLATLIVSQPNLSFMGALVLRNQNQREDSGFLRPGKRAMTLADIPDSSELSSKLLYPDGSKGYFGALEGFTKVSFVKYIFCFLNAIKGKEGDSHSNRYDFDLNGIFDSRLFHESAMNRLREKMKSKGFSLEEQEP